MLGAVLGEEVVLVAMASGGVDKYDGTRLGSGERSEVGYGWKDQRVHDNLQDKHGLQLRPMKGPPHHLYHQSRTIPHTPRQKATTSASLLFFSLRFSITPTAPLLLYQRRRVRFRR